MNPIQEKSMVFFFSWRAFWVETFCHYRLWVKNWSKDTKLSSNGEILMYPDKVIYGYENKLFISNIFFLQQESSVCQCDHISTIVVDDGPKLCKLSSFEYLKFRLDQNFYTCQKRIMRVEFWSD